MPKAHAYAATLAIDVRCEHCPPAAEQPRRHEVYLEMAPGRDGVPWYLCVRCWFEGLHPNNPRDMQASAVVQTT